MIQGSTRVEAIWEGPTQVDSGPFSDGKNIPYTNQDFRFTSKGGAVYAFDGACSKSVADDSGLG